MTDRLRAMLAYTAPVSLGVVCWLYAAHFPFAEQLLTARLVTD